MSNLPSTPGPSKSAVDRAGAILRDWWITAPPDASIPLEAVNLLFDFRAEFQSPMKKVTVGLRQFVNRERDPAAPVTVASASNVRRRSSRS